jgi:uncharacterized protein
MNMFRALIAILAAAVLAFTPALADEAKLTRMISVSGHGESSVVPDLASISLGVLSAAETAQAALAANTKTMNDLMALLRQAGVADADVATSNFSVNPRYDYGQPSNNGSSQPPKVVGYDVSNMVTVTARKIAMLGDLLDKAVQAGSNQIHGITFTVSKPDAMLDEARKAAVADARRKAELYATAAGVSLAGMISLSEGGGYVPPMPRAMKSAAAEQAVPLAQGEQALAVDVNVVWEIK